MAWMRCTSHQPNNLFHFELFKLKCSRQKERIRKKRPIKSSLSKRPRSQGWGSFQKQREGEFEGKWEPLRERGNLEHDYNAVFYPVGGDGLARINIEDEIYSDERFLELGRKLGRTDFALGTLVRAWRVAQKYWLINGVGIPIDAWHKQKLSPELLEVGLAEQRGEFIYVSGSKEQFAWLNAASENGKKGGPAAATARRAAKSEIIEESNQRKSTEIDGNQPLALSLSPPLSLSQTPSQKNLKSSEGGKKTPRAEGKSVATWEAYREAYQHRYGEAPVRNASVNGKLSQFVARIGQEEAPLVAAFFLTHNDRFYVTKMHDVGLLLKDAEKLRTEWATGQKMLGTIATQVERSQHNSDVWDRAAKLVNEKIEEKKNAI